MREREPAAATRRRCCSNSSIATYFAEHRPRHWPRACSRPRSAAATRADDRAHRSSRASNWPRAVPRLNAMSGHKLRLVQPLGGPADEPRPGPMPIDAHARRGSRDAVARCVDAIRRAHGAGARTPSGSPKPLMADARDAGHADYLVWNVAARRTLTSAPRRIALGDAPGARRSRDAGDAPWRAGVERHDHRQPARSAARSAGGSARKR